MRSAFQTSHSISFRRAPRVWKLLTLGATIIALATALPLTSMAAPKAEVKAPGRAPASLAPGGAPGASAPMASSQNPLDVRGQNRAWSRMVRARGEKETVNFVQTRKDYRAEIEAVRF